MGSITQTPILVRAMTAIDLAAVVKIEEESFVFPWTHSAFAAALRTAGVTSIVALSPGPKIAGFAVCRLSSHAVCLDNLAVSPAARRRGIGRRLIEQSQAAVYGSRDYLIKTVCELDDPAIGFLRACGFRAVRVIRGLYAGNRDGYQFAWKRPSTEGRS